MIVLVAKFRGKPGTGDLIASALEELVPLVRDREPGCLRYLVHRSTTDPEVFLLYEQYADEAALDAHRRAPHFKEIIEERVVPLLSEREREFYRLVASSGH